MLIPQEAQSEAPRRQGSAQGRLAELRCQLATPSRLSDGNRQRLLELARRLARVRALGGEYDRVELSVSARTALAAGGTPGGVALA
jgi:hypothetical protein